MIFIISVIVCIFSSMLDISKQFMAATNAKGMHTNDFVYLLPWIQDGRKDALPWVGSTGETMQNVKDNFGNAIVVM